MTTPRIAYRPKEAAELVGVSETTIRDAYRSGALRVHYLTSQPRITHADLMAWVEAAPTREQRQTA